MKKLITILGITLLSGLLAVPVIAWAQGWGRGHMMGNWGRGPGAYDQDDRGYGPALTQEQQERLTALDRKFYDETRELHDKLWDKSAELNAALAETSPDTAKVTGIQKEVSELRAKLDERRVAYELEVRKIAPETRYGRGYGRGGYGMGPGMMGGYGRDGYGMGPGMMGGYGGRGYGMGYGPGECWNN